MKEHVHCFCGKAASFLVLNRRKEWEPLCTGHLLWYMDNTPAGYMPQSEQITPCCNYTLHADRGVSNAPASNSKKCKQYYAAHREEISAKKREAYQIKAAQKRQESESRIVSVLIH